MKQATSEAIRKLAAQYTPQMTRFLQDMIAIPSESAEEKAVIARIVQEMETVGFDEVKIDGLGNVLGRIGHGRRVIAMDAHVDTVGVGDPSAWAHDPYAGKVNDGVIYGRGASDQEGGMAALVYGAKIIKQLELWGDYQLWIVGSVLEEDCDGLCWQYILDQKLIEPEVVVLTEPTDLQVYRGHRGRMEMEVHVSGRSAHGAMPHLGDNAVYKMAPIIKEIERLNERLEETTDPFLGKGTCTISEIRSTAPSLCAVADSCTIHIDRRLTVGETLDGALTELRNLPSMRRVNAQVRVLDYAREAYTGLVYPTKKYYPTWVVSEDAPVVRAAVSTVEHVLAREAQVSRWRFSTNGVATCGMHGIPTIGFGPANEVHAHTVADQCPIEHLGQAACFYAAFPLAYLETAR